MKNRTRIIPTLLIDDGNLVKTVKFSSPTYLGDPINAVKIFNEKYVDELCVMDIRATAERRQPNFELLKKIATEAFMPLSYGGGIDSLDTAKHLFKIGYEKIIISTLLYKNEDVVRQMAETFGSQSVVASIDYKKNLLGRKTCYYGDGKRKQAISPLEQALLVEKLGCGEILLYSMDRDGVGNGYDKETIESVAKGVSIPVIACGGANGIEDLKKAIDYGASAAAAGSMFVYFGEKKGILINYPSVDKFAEFGIDM